MISPTHPNTFTNLCGSLPPGTAWFPVLLLCEWNSCGETKGFDEPWGQNKSNNSEKHLTKNASFHIWVSYAHFPLETREKRPLAA